MFWALELVRDRETREPLVPFNAAGAAAAPMNEFAAACKQRGLWPFTHFNRTHVVPPCTTTADEVREGLAILDEALEVADRLYTGRLTPWTAGGPIAALADAAPAVFWLDRPDRPAPRPALDGATPPPTSWWSAAATPGCGPRCSPRSATPARDVLLLEARPVGWAASGRNGGFCAASLTHGEANGRARWPQEYAALHRLGRENLDAIEATVAALRHRLRLPAHRRAHGRHRSRTRWSGCARSRRGQRFLDRDAVRAEVDSPTYLAGRPRARRDRAWSTRPGWPGGWRAAAESLGVRIVEGTRVDRPRARTGPGCDVRTDARCRHRAPAGSRSGTNAFPSLRAPDAAAHRAGLRLRR